MKKFHSKSVAEFFSLILLLDMRFSIAAFGRIFSLTLVISVAFFSSINCFSTPLQRCLENELTTIFNIMTSAQTRYNLARPITDIDTKRAVNDILSLIRTCLTYPEVRNPYEKNFKSYGSRNFNRKFFFWPWRPWQTWNSPWQPQPSDAKTPFGSVAYGKISRPMGNGSSNKITNGAYYPSDDYTNQGVNYGLTENYGNFNTGHEYLNPSAYSNGGGFRSNSSSNGGIFNANSGTYDTYYTYNNNDRVIPPFLYYATGPNRYNYNNYESRYSPSNYDRYLQQYNLPSRPATQTNYDSLWRPHWYKRYSSLFQRNKEIKNGYIGNNGGTTEKNDHDFYRHEAYNSQDGRTQRDDHQFYWDGDRNAKEHNFYQNQNRRHLSSRMNININSEI